MDYNLKIIIKDTELLEQITEEQTEPYITDVKLEQSISLTALGIGSAASDCLKFTMINPFQSSFDGEKVELYISPQEDTSLDDLGTIQDEVGDDTADAAIDNDDVSALDDDDEGGETPTPEEEEAAEEASAEMTASLDTFFEGEEDEGQEFTTEEEEEPEWTMIGTYRVFAQNNATKDNAITFVCYDVLSQLGETFIPSEQTATIQELYDDLREQLSDEYGVTVDEYTFPSPVNRTYIWDMNVSYREALGYFAGYVGGYIAVDADESVGISFFRYNDTILLDSVLLKFSETSAGDTTVEGFECDISTSPYKTDIISTGPGQSISIKNPLMTSGALSAILSMYKGVRFAGAELSMLWNDDIQCGDFLRIMTAEEYANYLELTNALAETTDEDEVLSLKENRNSLGTVIQVSEQSINFAGDATASIKSVCRTEYAAANTTQAPSIAAFKRLYAEMIKADYIDANKVVTQGLQAGTAEIKQAIIDDIDVGSINGNKITNGSLLAAALSSEAVETLSGNKVYYQATAPEGTDHKDGDTWYKTVIADSDPDKKVLHIWDSTEEEWVSSDFDARVLRANTITAQEIASGTITAEEVNMENLQANIARVGDASGNHVDITDEGVSITGDGAEVIIGSDSVAMTARGLELVNMHIETPVSGMPYSMLETSRISTGFIELFAHGSDIPGMVPKVVGSDITSHLKFAFGVESAVRVPANSYVKVSIAVPAGMTPRLAFPALKSTNTTGNLDVHVHSINNSTVEFGIHNSMPSTVANPDLYWFVVGS